jgi:Transglycosylase-like domain
VARRRRDHRARRRLVGGIGRAAAVLVVAAVSAGVGTAPLGAQSTPPSADAVSTAEADVARLRAQADAMADQYFAAVGRLAAVEQQTDAIKQQLPALRAETQRLRDVMRGRAIAAYKRSGRDLGVIVGADDVLVAARRVQWLGRLNDRDDQVAEDAAAAAARLAEQRASLQSTRDEAAAALEQVKAQGKTIDALLVDAENRRRAAIAAVTPPPTARPAPDPAVPASPAPVAPVVPSAGPTAAAAPPKATPPVAPPTYVPTGGVHPHHDEPFLVCTRARESSSNYAAFNPAGPYLGAYQFLQATWNSAANHAGRSELIGVPPNVASQYDQDEVAWSLYQWRGAAPWGGQCTD